MDPLLAAAAAAYQFDPTQASLLSSGPPLLYRYEQENQLYLLRLTADGRWPLAPRPRRPVPRPASHILSAAPRKPARERPGNGRQLPVDTPALALVGLRHAR